MSNKIDIIHIGYHKTASTWFQQIGYLSHPGIHLINNEKRKMHNSFIDLFVEPQEFWYNQDQFKTKFLDKAIKQNKINVICEENLSGHSWTGFNSFNLMKRIKKTFGNPKIIIFIRSQEDMIQSLYSNYLISGGVLSFKRLINDINSDGHLVFKKLEYHKLIQQYQNTFGRKNVLVIPYEKFKKNNIECLKKILIFSGYKKIESETLKIENSYINSRISNLSILPLRLANFFSFGPALTPYIRKVFNKIGKKDFKIINQNIEKNVYKQWALSNKITQDLTGLDLAQYKYLISETYEES